MRIYFFLITKIWNISSFNMKVYFSNNNPEGRENKIYMAVRCGSTNSSSGFLFYCTQIPLSTPKPRLLELQPSLSSSLDEWWESYREDIPLPFKETSWNTHTFLLKFHLPTLSPKANLITGRMMSIIFYMSGKMISQIWAL